MSPPIFFIHVPPLPLPPLAATSILEALKYERDGQTDRQTKTRNEALVCIPVRAPSSREKFPVS